MALAKDSDEFKMKLKKYLDDIKEARRNSSGSLNSTKVTNSTSSKSSYEKLSKLAKSLDKMAKASPKANAAFYD